MSLGRLAKWADPEVSAREQLPEGCSQPAGQGRSPKQHNKLCCWKKRPDCSSQRMARAPLRLEGVGLKVDLNLEAALRELLSEG